MSKKEAIFTWHTHRVSRFHFACKEPKKSCVERSSHFAKDFVISESCLILNWRKKKQYMELGDSKFHFVHCLFPLSQKILKVCLMILQNIKKTWNARTPLRILFQFPNPTFFLQKRLLKTIWLYLSVRRNRSHFIKFFLTAPVDTLLISVTSHKHFYKEKDGNYCLLRGEKKYFLADFCSLKSGQKT